MRSEAARKAAAARTAKWRESNKERGEQKRDEWSANNKERVAAIKRAWYERNKAGALANAKAWKAKNPGSQYQEASMRRQAKPVWANDFFIKEAYALAKLREHRCGGRWHVDHIVPIKSSVVCGLHCETNLRVIPAKENIAKGNRHWPDMP